MTPELKELIEAGNELYKLTETLGTMASEYVRWNAREAALSRWLAAKLGIEAAHEDTPATRAQEPAYRQNHPDRIIRFES